MRKVKFKRWIDNTYRTVTNSNNQCIKIRNEDTGKWEENFTHEGVFHQWASAYEEFESGAGNYIVALIELENGEIIEVLPSNIKFIK